MIYSQSHKVSRNKGLLQKQFVRNLTLFLSCFTCMFPLYSQEEMDEPILFNSNEEIEVTLNYDIRDLQKNKYKTDLQWEADFVAKIGEEKFESKILVEPRGVFRRKFCIYPPIRLIFKECEHEEMQSWGKVKLVTHCKSGKVFEQFVLKEYLSYRLFNMISDMSFKVRLAKLTYSDTSGKRKPMTKWGFVIEQTKHLAKRHNAVELEEVKVNTQETNRQFMTLVSVFQYFLGNTDWSVPALHNIKLLKINDLKEPLPYAIPYDFDYSGMVNAPYAIPNDKLGIENVRERLFRGYPRSEEEFQKVYDLFHSKKADMYSLVEEFPHLEKFHKLEMIRFMDEFFTTIENPNLAKRRIAESARSR